MKQPQDMTIQGHLNGDADGLGMYRGVVNAIIAETIIAGILLSILYLLGVIGCLTKNHF
jgi:hypothetical protein